MLKSTLPSAESVRRNRSAGFTLVELLVVIAIIGVLVALLLPAVQAAREAARRTHCTNNLKQLGLAMQLHHDARGQFPPGHVWGSDASPKKGMPREATWVFFLLPFLEEGNTASQMEADFGQTNSKQVRMRALPAYTCPSNPPSGNWNASDLAWGNYARGNYGANNGIGPMQESDLGDLPVTRMAGAFYLDSELKLKDFTDGSSNTVLVAELVNVPGDVDFRGVLFYPEGPLIHHNYTPNSSVPDNVRSGFCEPEPLSSPCLGVYSDWLSRQLVMSSRSHHPGGVNVVMGDASGTWVGDAVDASIWKSASSPSEVVGDVQFTGFQ